MSRYTPSHPPYDKLKGFIRERGLTYGDIANLLGISVTAVTSKINGRSDFFLSEVQAIKREYQPDRDIFV